MEASCSKLDAVANAVGSVQQDADAEGGDRTAAEIADFLGELVVKNFEIVFSNAGRACCGGSRTVKRTSTRLTTVIAFGQSLGGGSWLGEAGGVDGGLGAQGIA